MLNNRSRTHSVDTTCSRGRRDPFPESNEMEAVRIETKTTTVGAAPDIVAVEAGIATVTEKEPGNTAAMITNADVVPMEPL